MLDLFLRLTAIMTIYNLFSIEECRNELIEVLEEWILLKTRDHEEIPLIEGIDINIKMITV